MAGQSGQLEAGTAEFREVLDDRRRVLGPHHPETLATQFRLAHWTAQSGQINHAIAEFREASDHRLRVLGLTTPDVARTREDLAHWLV